MVLVPEAKKGYGSAWMWMDGEIEGRGGLGGRGRKRGGGGRKRWGRGEEKEGGKGNEEKRMGEGGEKERGKRGMRKKEYPLVRRETLQGEYKSVEQIPNSIFTISPFSKICHFIPRRAK